MKKRPWHRCFPENFAKIFKIPFYRTPPGDCSCNNKIGENHKQQSRCVLKRKCTKNFGKLAGGLALNEVAGF